MRRFVLPNPDPEFIGDKGIRKPPGMFRTAWVLNRQHPDYQHISEELGVVSSYFLLPVKKGTIMRKEPAYHVFHDGRGLKQVFLNRQRHIERPGMSPVGAPIVGEWIITQGGAHTYQEIKGPDERRNFLKTHTQLASRLLDFLRNPPEGVKLDDRDKELMRWLEDHVDQSRRWFAQHKGLF